MAENGAIGTTRREVHERSRRDPQEDRGGGSAAEREADRERKRETARCVKEAGPEAIRKGKYPRCTQ